MVIGTASVTITASSSMLDIMMFSSSYSEIWLGIYLSTWLVFKWMVVSALCVKSFFRNDFFSARSVDNEGGMECSDIKSSWTNKIICGGIDN